VTLAERAEHLPDVRVAIADVRRRLLPIFAALGHRAPASTGG
jgi:hypothetical protein